MMLLYLAFLSSLSMISAYPMYADVLKTKRPAPEGVQIVYPAPLILGSELIPGELTGCLFFALVLIALSHDTSSLDRFHPFMAPGPTDMRGPCRK